MAISSDMLIERAKIKRQLSFWRVAAIAAVILFLLVLMRPDDSDDATASKFSSDYIARVTIDGVITDDRKMQELLEQLRDNPKVKAVIFYLNTPGGTAVGGENLFRLINQIKAKKPVVATMGSLCASAGYMIAMAADRVYAMEGTITASIGVILQTAEFTGLAEKLGVSPIVIKSGPLKGSPNPLEKLTPGAHEELQSLVDDFFGTFKKMVADSRHLSPAEIDHIADGRVVGGAEAVRLKLVDQLGGETEALAWLHESKKIPANLAVKDVEPKKDKKGLVERFTDSAASEIIPSAVSNLRLQGLLLIWQPALGR